jgi:hypothetical protein
MYELQQVGESEDNLRYLLLCDSHAYHQLWHPHKQAEEVLYK